MIRKIIIKVAVFCIFVTWMFVSFGQDIAAGQTNAVQISARVTDPLTEKQTYLQQIHMNEAWDVANSNDSIVIAVVDTGVDLNHPDLIPNLVEGANLIKPNQPPYDDNGHGTNVAGVIGAAANNDKGISGILWKTNIMPIKALESDGTGTETKLGEGIRYAVDHGAKIVVLSLGLNRYSSYMSESVRYAEDHDVLLVAATGNEGNRVKYPAAYPTVLAVGGVTTNNVAHELSNTGPEIDVVAPWDVFTTALGGGYEYKDGTSMAAPQVAAVCALAWAKYPWMKPYQIRSLIRQTAEDLDGNGWNPGTGYGLLRADRVMTEPYLDDMYKPNHRKDQAKAISVSKMISASFVNGDDQDWFTFDAPYDGSVTLELEMQEGYEVSVAHTDASGGSGNYTISTHHAVTLPVSKGKSYVQLQLKDHTVKQKLIYKLTTSFEIYTDPYGDKDRQYKAYVLPVHSQTIVGTFSKGNNQDWYMLPVNQSGKLSIKLSVDTARIDPVLFVQKRGEKGIIIDKGGEGETENLPEINVFPGDYYIRVSNTEGYPTPITGEYTMSIDFKPKLLDPNEPNDKPYLATVMQKDTLYEGLIDNERDVDWFSLKINEESLVELHLSGIPSNVQMSMLTYNGKLKPLDSVVNPVGATEVTFSQRWQPGIYYIQLSANTPFDYQMYGLEAEVKPLLGGFSDINGHWAANDILLATDQKIVDGYDNYRFMPDKPIKRAEAAAILVRGFKLAKQQDVHYTDLDFTYWAYPYIAKAAKAGIIEGYPDQTIAPEQQLTRMEMVAMIAKGMKLNGKLRGLVPFTDVDQNYWGISILKQMKAEGWIIGFPDGRFYPEQQATRAEFVTILEHILRESTRYGP